MVRPDNHPRRKLKIRRGDTIQVRRGKDRGKRGRVQAVLPDVHRVLVDRINLVKKHVRPRRANEKGQRVNIAAPLPIANVQLVCPSCQKATRVGIRRAGFVRERTCRRCEAVIPGLAA